MYGEKSAEIASQSPVIQADEVISSSNQSQPIRERGIKASLWGSPLRKVGSVLTTATVLAGGGFLLAEGSGGGVASVDPAIAAAAAGTLPSGVTNHENCDDPDITYSSFAGHPGQLVPGTENVTSQDEAASYNQGLFDKGNQGTDIDPVASATFYALMGYPATNSGTDNESSVHNIFSQAYNQIQGLGKSAAKNFCNINESVTSETFGYDPTAIATNVPYTQISGVVGSDGHNDDIALKQFTNHSDTIGGVTYKLQNSNTVSDFNGFVEVIIPSNGHGVIDVLGLLPNAGTNNEQQNQGPSGTQQVKNNSASAGNTGNTGERGNTSTGPAAGVKSAPGSQENKQGPVPVTTGPLPTPGPGSPAGNTTTTAPNRAPVTTTTSPNRAPTTTTTTAPVTKTSNPNQGGCDDPFDPTCQG